METGVLLLILGLCLSTRVHEIETCTEGYTQDNKGTCLDENECDSLPPICGNNATCINTPGSYYCNCKTGFRSSKENFTAEDSHCQDINECTENTHTCDPSQTCDNTMGSYKCVCRKGFRKRSDHRGCEDVDECVETPPVCGPSGTCTNTPGSYTCTCPEGFRNRGNNLTAPCEDVDECVETPPDCGPRGTCTNTRGSYTCTCPEGFRNRGNDLTAPCEDKDECGTGSGTCGSDSEGKCTNTEGSYTCECLPGHSNYGKRQGKCTKLSCDGYQMTSNDQAVGGLAHLWKKMRQNCEGLTNGTGEPGHGAGNGMLEDMLSGTDDFMSSGQSVGDSNQVTGLLTMMEKAMMLIGPQLKQNHTKMESNHIEVEIAVKRGETPPTGPVLLKTANAAFKTSWETAAGNSGTYPGFTVAALVSYKSLDSTPASSFEALKKEMEAERRKEQEEQEEQKELVSLQIISNVVTACISNPHPHHLDQRVNFTFKHHQELNESARLNYTCVFWDRDSWSRRGCESSSTSTHTTCSCDHLSSFAVLMALYDIKHTFELKLITWIGLAVSLACLLVCILTFGLCRSIKGTRTTIHLHLSLCLFLADLIFLCGINRAQKAGCGLVAGLLHYFFLAAFSWMLLEGVQLYRMVVLVFHTSLRPAYMLAAGYGAPLAIIIVSAIAYPQGYGTDQHCWLSLDRGFIWAFFGPVCVIIFLNAFFFLITLWKLAEKLSSLNPDLSNLQKIKGFTVAAVAQLCVLGGMWMFGCFMFQSVVMVYLFTILNSLQGALIFIMHCLMSKPVREEYAKFLQGIWTPGKGSYTDYTSNPSSNSQQPLKTSHSTGQSQL